LLTDVPERQRVQIQTLLDHIDRHVKLISIHSRVYQDATPDALYNRLVGLAEDYARAVSHLQTAMHEYLDPETKLSDVSDLLDEL
jgi:hypothetical protein